MKLLLNLLIFSLSSHMLLSQCDGANLEREIQSSIANKYRKNMSSTLGMISYQSEEDNYYYQDQETPLYYLGFAKSIWTAGTDPAGNLKFSGNTFANTNRHDFNPGPLDENGQPLDTLCSYFNRIWKVTQFDIVSLQSMAAAGNITIDNVSQDILEWPAIGNPHFATDINQPLASFFDANSDGTYNALDGDYPLALEESPTFLPSEFSFLVFNDMKVHTYSQADALGMEFHQTNYVVNCTSESPSEHTVYSSIKYLYKGQETLTDFRLALWEDSDLACNVNDYQGCDQELNCTYFYNKGGVSWTEECHDPDVPNNNGAIRSTVFLNESMKSHRHYYLNGIGDQNPATIDPAGLQEHWDYLNNLWRDGTPLTVGNNGYNPGSTDVTQFAFPDRPNDPDGWSMQTASIDTPLDARALTTLVNGELLPGAVGRIDIADYMLYDTTRKFLEVFDIWPTRIAQIKTDFAAMKDGSYDCGGAIELCTEDCVWPGDANRDACVSGYDFVYTGVLAGMEITNGTARGRVATDWFPFSADNWNTMIQGIDAKNGDANGNGIINVTDLEVVETNFNLTRSGAVAKEELWINTNPDGLRMELETDFVDLENAQLFDRIINAQVWLGDQNDRIPEEIHGLSFDIRFDTNLIIPFNKLADLRQNVFTYDFANYNDIGRVGNELQGDNKISIAATNFNGVDERTVGKLFEQDLYIRDNATTSNVDGKDTLVIKFYNVLAMNASGDIIELGTQYDTLVIDNLIVDADVISSTPEVSQDQQTLSLYPNPAIDLLNIYLGSASTGTLTVRNIDGKSLIKKQINNLESVSIPIAQLKVGYYFISFNNGDEVVTEGFIKN